MHVDVFSSIVGPAAAYDLYCAAATPPTVLEFSQSLDRDRANIVTSPTVVSGQRPRLTLTFFCTLLCYFSVVLYKCVL